MPANAKGYFQCSVYFDPAMEPVINDRLKQLDNTALNAYLRNLVFKDLEVAGLIKTRPITHTMVEPIILNRSNRVPQTAGVTVATEDDDDDE